MKNIIPLFYLLSLTLLFTACKEKSADYDPASVLSESEAGNFKYSISRYVGRLPKYATEDTKFELKFDNDYRMIASKIKLDKYYAGNGDTIYFEISKIAPSLHLKKTATGGKLVKNAAGEITYYEEVYRTWKMTDSLLAIRTPLFFEAMIRNRDLTKYYTENINSDTYIEFPNKFVIFDVKLRKWISNSDLAYNR